MDNNEWSFIWNHGTPTNAALDYFRSEAIRILVNENNHLREEFVMEETSITLEEFKNASVHTLWEYCRIDHLLDEEDERQGIHGIQHFTDWSRFILSNRPEELRRFLLLREMLSLVR